MTCSASLLVVCRVREFATPHTVYRGLVGEGYVKLLFGRYYTQYAPAALHTEHGALKELGYVNLLHYPQYIAA